jgi:hypothetical protein
VPSARTENAPAAAVHRKTLAAAVHRKTQGSHGGVVAPALLKKSAAGRVV